MIEDVVVVDVVGAVGAENEPINLTGQEEGGKKEKDKVRLGWDSG